MTKVITQDTLDRQINSFAMASFRDMADGDYITARMACRAGLMPQFLWSAQQAFEKYLKCILLINRIPATNVGHNLVRAMELTRKVSYPPKLRSSSQKFFDHIATYGERRYLDGCYFVEGHPLFELDMTVWDLRRYCQVLDVFGKELPKHEQALLSAAHADLEQSEQRPPQHFRLHNGKLESILDDLKNPARGPLVWNNGFFNGSRRRKVRIRHVMYATNAPLTNFPYMLDDLLKYIQMPRGDEREWRKFLEEETNREGPVEMVA